MQMTDGVWVSQVPRDSTLIEGFDSDVYLTDEDLAVDAMRRSRAGEPLPQDRFPQEMYGEYPDKKYGRQPDLFLGGGFWIVSSEFADVLRSVNLGRSALYPVKLFQHDRKTPVEGAYFSLNIGETKKSLILDQSTGLNKPTYPDASGLDVRYLPFEPTDGDIAVRDSALDGSNLWIDPLLRDGIFLSDRLVQVLKAAKLTRRLGLIKARIIRVN